jgi:hypothetical protein
VGFGAIELEPGAEPEPVLVDERLTDGLGELLAAALSGRAEAITRFRSRRAPEVRRAPEGPSAAAAA